MSKKETYPIETVRHSTAHVLAAAVSELYPGTKFGVGPVIENGFFYDLDLPAPITPQDLLRIEKRMKEIIRRREKFVRKEMPLTKAISFFENLGQGYKVELLRDLMARGTTSMRPEEAQDVNLEKPTSVSVYETGKFVDLCRGPHIGDSGEVGAFKLTKIAGAYWRGSEKNKMLTRIYGLAFKSEAELKAYLVLLEEAEKRDHRKLGAELELFMISPDVGMGLPIWLPKGAFIRRKMADLVRAFEEKKGYQYVDTPHIGRKRLYETSGHWQHYRETMYSPLDIEGEEYILKPMNCPHHIQVYALRPRSYRELPIKLAEDGTVYRFEKSGELSGLSRVRGFTQNDAHIFCAPEQIKKEVALLIGLTKAIYKALGIKNVWLRLSLRDPKDTVKYVADGKMWERAEKALRDALDSRKAKYVEAEGEAAFYGPKIDFQAKDVLGREFTVSTIQLDFSLPLKFGLEYIGDDGEKHRPVMIHRAYFGSFERFFAFLIEHYGGAFPLWLSSVQVAILPVGKDHWKASAKLEAMLKKQGIRAEADASRETVGYKIRKAEKMKVPYMLVIGDKEKDLRTLAVRKRGEAEIKKMTLAGFVKKLQTDLKKMK
ncbi:threonine--tRNA ligase [Candidatus Uhrbacteria bacterium]|nr:threonine--tRNA ligase [Candidatus Uhrbacteria bacterium]